MLIDELFKKEDNRKMEQFRVLEGRNRKPTKKQYEMARMRLLKKNKLFIECISMETLLEEYPITFYQYIYLSVKFFITTWNPNKKYTEDSLQSYLKQLYLLEDGIKCLTPRQFMQIFPVTKRYDGEKKQKKDYFFTKETMQSYGMDVPIGEKVVAFLYCYCNKEVESFTEILFKLSHRRYQMDEEEKWFYDFDGEQDQYLISERQKEEKKKRKQLFQVLS